MKGVFALIVLCAFTGVALFGFSAMLGEDGGHAFANCIAATISGSMCPSVANLLGFVSFHLDALKVFSQAVFTGLFSILAAYALRFVCVRTLRLPRVHLVLCAASRRAPRRSLFPRRRKIVRWLSLHESSPTLR